MTVGKWTEKYRGYGKTSNSSNTWVVNRFNSLSCSPQYLVPGDTLPRGKVSHPSLSCPRGHFTSGVKCPPIKLISYLFFFYNFYSATYFIALKMNFFCVKSTMNGQNKNCSRFCTRAFWMYFTFVFLCFTAWFIILINFCCTALGLLFQSFLKWKPRNWAKAVGETLTQGSVPQPSCLFHFYVMIKGIVNSLVIWSFWKPFKRILETFSPISSLWT